MSSPLFSKYLSKTGDIPLLTREREAELGRIVQTGLRPEATENQKRACEDAQHELVQKNLKLVVGTAKRFLRGALTLEEMTSDGNQGLTEAAKRYNPAFKTRFSNVRDMVDSTGDPGRFIPGADNPDARPTRKATTQNSEFWKFRRRGARDQDLDKIEKETEIPRETIIRVLNGACTLVSINAPHNDGDEPLEAAIDSGCEDPVMAAMRIEESQMVLSPPYRSSVRLRGMSFLSGSDEWEKPTTLHRLAAIYGVTHERVRQIEKRALRILRRKLVGANAILARTNNCGVPSHPTLS